MARLINTKTEQSLYVTIKTIFVDGTESTRKFGVGDVIKGLRYVLDGEIATVSGKVTAINYIMNSKLTWNKSKPADTIATDMVLKSIVIDASSQYESKIVTIPCNEILEDEGVENVKMVTCIPSLLFEIWMYYSNHSNNYAAVEVNDTFDNVRIINPNKIGYDNDYVGSYTCIGMAYRTVGNKCVITGLAFKNVDNGSVVVTDIDKILSLNEIFTHTPNNVDDLVEALGGANDGDTIKLSGDISINSTTPVVFDGVSLTLDLAGNALETDGSTESRILVKNGVVTLDDSTGDGVLKNETAYDSTHSSTILSVAEGGKLVINNAKMNAVVGDTIADQVNKGQFGINIIDDGQLVINGGELVAGWYPVSDHGANTNINAELVINDGQIVSTADFALYKASPSDKWTINGGTIIGAAGALAINNGKVTINGGTFRTTMDGNTGTATDGTGNLANALINIGCKYGACELTITGGRFIAPAGAPLFLCGTKNTVTINISGGEFSDIPDAAYIAPGYRCSTVKNNNGYYFIYKVE